ncbi:uncharacterized protein LOC105638222 isoform X1 [Jatropha curcas]|uniref:uncharacterized protein LOC105638222 isoform X1 n=1 Tax=Jatropha curcas TaxID=180498 RepID=UPI0018950F5A|nr:uncharacterized protein LOC105638222 isoform X1 [Jatropha curcas]XP_037496725.1 uncharacterized protein LOC105638222 isoform X1 [Jatropha curcas]
MDPWAIHVKNSTHSPFSVRNYSMIPEKPNSWNFGTVRLLEFRFWRRKLTSSSSSSSSSSYGYHSLFIRAMAKKNNNGYKLLEYHLKIQGRFACSRKSAFELQYVSFGAGRSINREREEKALCLTHARNGDRSIPGGDSSKGNSPGDKKSNDNSSQKSHGVNLDWREFRAKMVIQEQAEIAETDAANQAGSPRDSKPLGLKWAHPISVPETGCVLVATEKLDGVRTFDRTVVLLLRSGTRHPQEGPFGVVINRPLNKKIKHMKPNSNELATTFADCSLHFGGPLEASMFLLKTGEKAKLPGLEEVVPGLCFGARNSLDEAAKLVKKGVLKPQDFRFFVGYAGWQLDQLREEIESDYWYVASCSSNLICGGSSDSSSERLWEEILQLMGGPYSELSRKPKQDM